MKCNNCGFDNHEGAKFCSNCGNKMEEMNCCTNPECENYNLHVIPMESSFCPKCGNKIKVTADAPFHIKYPEYGLVPLADFRYHDHVKFVFNKPEFIQDKYLSEGVNFFIIARQKKLGVLRYEYHKKKIKVFDVHDIKRIIPCEYNKIEISDNNDYFICYKGDNKVFIDNEGKFLN